MEDENPEMTPGYKPGEKKSVEEYQKMDEDDESLRKYKEALLGKAGDLGGSFIFCFCFNIINQEIVYVTS